MGTWGTAIKDSDAFADVYTEFFNLYNKGEQPDNISSTIKSSYNAMLDIEEEKHGFWFALAFAQWETKSLDSEVLSKVEKIIYSGDDLQLWLDLGASNQDIKKRKIALDGFLENQKRWLFAFRLNRQSKPKGASCSRCAINTYLPFMPFNNFFTDI
jgi:hypothetical protein